MFLTLVNHLKQSKYMYSEIVIREFKMATNMAARIYKFTQFPRI